jgi:hypothetical protein
MAQLLKPMNCVCFRAYSYICNAASKNDNGPVAALERPLPLLGVQRLSTSLNAVQRHSTAFNTRDIISVETR